MTVIVLDPCTSQERDCSCGGTPEYRIIESGQPDVFRCDGCLEAFFE